MTLRSRLALSFLLVVLLPLVVGTALLQQAVPAAVQARQDRALAAEAALAGRLLSAACDRAGAVAAGAARAAAADPDPARLRALARGLVADGVVDGVRLRGVQGDVLAEAGALPARAVDCRTRPLPAAPFLSARLQLETTDREPAGAVEAALRLDRLVATLGTGGGRTTAVLADDGTPLAGQADPALARRALARPGRTVRDDERAALAVVDGPRPVLVAEPLAPLPPLLRLAAAVLLGAAALAGVLATLLARALVRPLAELGEAAGQVAAGRLDTTLEVRGDDEVGRLGEAFNAMTADLRAYVRALEAGRDELQAGLARLGATLSSSHDLDRILAVVLESAVAATRARSGVALLLAPERDALVLAAARGVDVPDGLRLPLGRGVAGTVARTGEALRGRTGRGRGRLRPGPGEPEAASVLCVPFTSSGRVLGVLVLHDRLGAEEFDDNDLASVRAFAAQAGVAVDNVLLHRDVQRMAVTDGLTGLGNRRRLTDVLERETERAGRYARPLALLLLDLDRFKQVNDVHGHQRGDAVLVELAARVTEAVRDVDTVARYGGEEVCVVLPETDEAGARQAAERVCAAVRARPFGGPGEEPLAVTVSVGVAVLPQHGEDPESLLRAADAALYEAKAAGRDTWRVAVGGGV